MDNIFRRNLPYKLVAFLIAILVWIYVTNEQNPSSTMSSQVPLEPFGLKSGYAIVEIAPAVKVRLQGKRSLLEATDSKDVRAFVNLSKANKGTNYLPVEITSPSGLQVIDKNPAKVKVVIDQMKEKQVPVQAVIKGKPAAGYKRLVALVEPNQVRVRGPESSIKNIDHAEITINIDGKSKTVDQTMPVLLIDQNGKEVATAANTMPSNISITVPIFKEDEVKKVNVQTHITGQPAAGYEVSSVIVEPQGISIFGDKSLLKGINQVHTGDINIDGAKADVAKVVNVLLPSGVKVVKSGRVKVFVHIVAQPVEKNTYPVSITTQNLDPALKAALSPQNVTVTIEGKPADFDPGKIKAFIDLAGLGKGTHQVDVQVDSGSGLNVVTVEPRTVTVTLE